MTERLTDASRALLDDEGPLDEPTALELEAHRQRVFASLGLPLPLPPIDPSGAGAAGGGAAEHTSAAARANAPGAGAGVGLAPKLVVLAIAASSVALFVARPSMRPPRSPATQHARSAQRAAPAVGPSPDLARVDAGAHALGLDAPPNTQAPQTPRITSARVPPVAARDTTLAPTAPSVNDTAAPAPVAAPSSTPEDALAEQSMLVAAAEAHLRAGHAAEALSLFDRSLARHPTGTLRVESLAGRIAALCRLGRVDLGRVELARFIDAYPRSPSAPRLRAACGVDE